MSMWEGIWPLDLPPLVQRRIRGLEIRLLNAQQMLDAHQPTEVELELRLMTEARDVALRHGAEQRARADRAEAERDDARRKVCEQNHNPHGAPSKSEVAMAYGWPGLYDEDGG